MSHGEIEALLAKYTEMLSMRLAHDAGEEDHGAVRVRMAVLASRFPGALRELDELELGVIRERIDRLDEVLRAQGVVEPWMSAVARFHALARGALSAKRWLARRRAIEPGVLEAYRIHCSALSGDGASADALVWADDLAAIAAPPRGRVLDLVFARMAASLGILERDARILVFGRADRRE